MRGVIVTACLAWCLYRIVRQMKGWRMPADDGIVWNNAIESRIKKSRVRGVMSSNTAEVKEHDKQYALHLRG